MIGVETNFDCKKDAKFKLQGHFEENLNVFMQPKQKLCFLNFRRFNAFVFLQ